MGLRMIQVNRHVGNLLQSTQDTEVGQIYHPYTQVAETLSLDRIRVRTKDTYLPSTYTRIVQTC
jgi:hypothetical protein